MKCRKAINIIVLLTLMPIISSGKRIDFPAVTGFELERYLGIWYEIARLPNSFEKDLIRVTAQYSMRPDGLVRVLNRGVRPRDGRQKQAVGRAKFAGERDRGHLKVSFFGPFFADYIIMELGREYEYALVAGGSAKYLWILARKPVISDELRDNLLKRAAELGFPVERLYFVPQE